MNKSVLQPYDLFRKQRVLIYILGKLSLNPSKAIGCYIHQEHGNYVEPTYSCYSKSAHRKRSAF